MACKWINGAFAQGTKYKEKIGKIQRILHSWWKKGVAKPISNIGSFVNHVHREHSQEADHWANMGAQSDRINVIARRGESVHSVEGEKRVLGWKLHRHWQKQVWNQRV